jgi:nucleoid-associated protein YgaU
MWALPDWASEDAAAGEAAQQQQPPVPARVQSLRRLGGATTRFVAPIRTVDALRRSMSRPNIQRDIARVMEGAGVGSLTADVQRILSQGMVTETTMAPGTTMEFMALRRGGRAGIMRNQRWDGRQAVEGYEFIIDNLSETYTFFVPEICGNIALVRREPSREAARRAAEAAAAKAAADKAAADKAAADKAAADKAAADAAEAARRAEEARQAEAARLAQEERDAARRPFLMGMVGKQQRQYDDHDPSDIFTLTNPVHAAGDALIGVKGGIAFKLSPHWSFSPALGFAGNTEHGERSTLFGDTEVTYTFLRKPVSFGTGLTFWDWTHDDIFTLGWLGTVGFPVWKSDAKKHNLYIAGEWRQFFDRMSDPDVNYMFWGGVKYVFK